MGITADSLSAEDYGNLFPALSNGDTAALARQEDFFDVRTMWDVVVLADGTTALV